MKRAREVLILSAILTILSAFLAHSALSTFDFFDMSAFMDAGYRVLIGQTPYLDFYYNAGPMHLYMHAFFFAILGFGKNAILAHLLTVNAIAAILLYFMARKRLPPFEGALATVIGAVSFYLPISHPWYDQNAAFWIIAGLAALELGGPRAFTAGLLAGLGILTKTNVGLFGAAALLVVADTGRVRFIVGAAAGSIGMLAVQGLLDDFIYQTLIAYTDTRDRLTDLEKLRRAILFNPSAYLFLISAIFRFRRAAAFALTGFLSAFTSSMNAPTNLIFLGATFLYLFASVRHDRIFRGAALALWLTAFAHVAMFARFPSQWYWRDSNVDNSYAMKTPAMRGWRCGSERGPGFDWAVEKAAGLPRHESLFVFPDATIIYGLAGRESYRPAPFIFHVRQMPAPGRLYDEFRHAFLDAPPDWILLHEENEVWKFDTRELLTWLRLREFIRNNYNVIDAHGTFQLLEKIDNSS